MVRVSLLMVGSLSIAILPSPRLLFFCSLDPNCSDRADFRLLTEPFRRIWQVQRRLDVINTVMQENLAGVRVVKAFARDIDEIERFRRTNDNLIDANIAVVRTGRSRCPSHDADELNLGIVAVIWLGGIQVVRWAVSKWGIYSIYQLPDANTDVAHDGQYACRSRLASRGVGGTDRRSAGDRAEIRSLPNALTTFSPRGRVAFRM